MRELNWGLKACYYKSKFDSATQLKLRSKILPLRLLCEMRCAIYFSKVLFHELPAFHVRPFPNSNFTHSKRNNRTTVKLRCRTNYLRNSFLVSSERIWNTLPQDLKKTNKKFTSFKKSIKEYFLSLFESNPNDRIINHSWHNFIIR